MRPTIQCLRRKAVLEKVGISSTQLFNLERAGDFPAHFMLSPRCAVWSEAEIDQWLWERANKSAKALPGPSRKACSTPAAAPVNEPRHG